MVAFRSKVPILCDGAAKRIAVDWADTETTYSLCQFIEFGMVNDDVRNEAEIEMHHARQNTTPERYAELVELVRYLAAVPSRGPVQGWRRVWSEAAVCGVRRRIDGWIVLCSCDSKD